MFDFVGQVESELHDERTALARHVDRVEALAELRTYALGVQADLRRPIEVEDLWRSVKNERQRAELQALLDRVTAYPERAVAP